MDEKRNTKSDRTNEHYSWAKIVYSRGILEEDKVEKVEKE